MQRVRGVETALQAELTALRAMRADDDAGVFSPDRTLLPASAVSSSPPVLPSDLEGLQAELRAAERDVALAEVATAEAEAGSLRAEAELRSEVERLGSLKSALRSEVSEADAAGKAQRRAWREAGIWEQLLQQRREALVGELCELYPVLRRDRLRNVYSIKGLLLTERDVGKMGEENTSTALGYVAHATDLLARYLHQPLRYEIVPIASRSWVRDRVDPYTPRRYFPLFSKGQAKDDFLVAMKMLRRNVEQLLVSQGLTIPEGMPLLGKLQILVMGLLGRSIESSAASATTPTAGGGPRSVGGAGSADPGVEASGWQLV
jgi:hypothetical protein